MLLSSSITELSRADSFLIQCFLPVYVPSSSIKFRPIPTGSIWDGQEQNWERFFLHWTKSADFVTGTLVAACTFQFLIQ